MLLTIIFCFDAGINLFLNRSVRLGPTNGSVNIFQVTPSMFLRARPSGTTPPTNTPKHGFPQWQTMYGVRCGVLLNSTEQRQVVFRTIHAVEQIDTFNN